MLGSAKDLVWYADPRDPGSAKGVFGWEISEALQDQWQLPLLSQLVPSQWGDVHLFDLCISFGYPNTAWAMVDAGVTGCRVEERHLKRTVAPPINPGFWEGWESEWPTCSCAEQFRRCKFCCFGFPAETGTNQIWTKDWSASLREAQQAARESAMDPLVQRILDALCSGAKLPELSDEAGAHLLDIAILIGNKEAATRLADLCQFRPFRRWRSGNFFVEVFEDNECCLFELRLSNRQIGLRDPSMVAAALVAGAQLLRLMVFFPEDRFFEPFFELPMWLALVLSGHCRELSHLLPLHCGSADQEWLKRFEKDGAASLLLSKSGWKVTRVIEELQVVGIPLTSITFNAGFDLFWRSWKGLLSLLDLAVLQEDSALAARLACAGVSLSRNVVHCIIAENFKLADDDAAMIAVRAASGHEICTKRVVILQVFQKIWGGRTPPAELLKEVLALSIDVPEMVRELDLPEVWDVWEKSWASLNSAPCQEPSSKAASIGGEVRIQQEASVQAMHEVDDPPEPSISKTTGENLGLGVCVGVGPPFLKLF